MKKLLEAIPSYKDKLGKDIGGDYQGMRNFVQNVFPSLEEAIGRYEERIILLNKAMSLQAAKLSGEYKDLKTSHGQLSRDAVSKDKVINEKIAEISTLQRLHRDQIKKIEDMMLELSGLASQKGINIPVSAPPQSRSQSDPWDMPKVLKNEPKPKDGEPVPALDPDKSYRVDMESFFAKTKEVLDTLNQSREQIDQEVATLKEKLQAAEQEKGDLRGKISGLESGDQASAFYIKQLQRIQGNLENKLKLALTTLAKVEKEKSELQGHAQKTDVYKKQEAVDPDHLKNYGTFNLMEYLETNYKAEKSKK